ncbi:MAG TPA: type I-C CRISPR-associated protein Cas8c/Csd1 [Anaerolineaceae bacterium]|nr:type I-C CRISPR-associated protein Cas8c/Csd1 [Anaerolineaceae bacterium]
MILHALYRYYEILLRDPKIEIALPGYSSANVNFALNLSKDGDLLDLFPFSTRIVQGKKEREIPSVHMNVPERVSLTSGVNPSFICDKAVYVLGISNKDYKDPDFINKCYEAFKKFNIELLSRANSPVSRAVTAFLEKYEPATARLNPVISRHLAELEKGAILIFWVENQNVLDDPEVRRVWEEHCLQGDSKLMQCLVSGEKAPIARLHPNFQGVRDTKMSGAYLVSFNERAYESYNRKEEQGLNSPVSQRVASGYGVALNYLLSASNSNRKIHIGDATVVYWAESTDTRYGNMFASLLNPDFVEGAPERPQQARQETEELLGRVAKKVERGQGMDIEQLSQGLESSTPFYVLGLSPNASRISVRFFINDAFEKFITRIISHYEDLKIVKEYPDQPDRISIYRIINECVSPKIGKREEEIKSRLSLIGGALLRSILTGTPYPESLYSFIINRVRVDMDDKEKHHYKVNYVRAAVIKACLLRKYRNYVNHPYKEVLQMSLNEEFTNPAYVLGRLFAVLEKAQTEAVGDANASIKDRYFASACATPASVFPVLLKLSQHHTAKAKFGKTTDHRIQQLLSLLEAVGKPFPSRLSLDEQGIFILGYYHQRAAFYVKTAEESAETTAAEFEE